MDDNGMTSVIGQRLRKARENLSASQLLLAGRFFNESVNRSYYAVFHAIRAVVAVKGFDSAKHSGIIAFFNAEFVKTGIFDKQISKIIDLAFRMREKSDYLDYFDVPEDDAADLLGKARFVVSEVETWLISEGHVKEERD